MKAGVSSEVNGVGRRGGRMDGRNGGRQIPIVRCLNQVLNKEMNSMSTAIVRRCEMSGSGRVISLSLEFLLDENQTLWLVRTTECETAENDRVRKGVDQDVSHGKRTERAQRADVEMQKVGRRAKPKQKGGGDENNNNGSNNNDDQYNQYNDDDDEESFPQDFGHSGLAGSRTENRVRIRNRRRRIPDEELVELIMNEDDPEMASKKRKEVSDDEHQVGKE